MHEATLNYEEKLVRQGVRCFWKRSLGVGYWLILLMIFMSLAYLLTGPKTPPWILVTMSVAVVLASIFPVLLYVVHYRSSMGSFRSMDEPTAQLIANEDTFGFSSSTGESKLKWNVVKGIWKCKDLWLLEYKQGGFNVLPLASIPEAMQSFIEEQVTSAGGKVR